MGHGNKKYTSEELYYIFRGQTCHDCRTLPVSMPNFNVQNNKIGGRFLEFSKSKVLNIKFSLKISVPCCC